MKTVLNHEQIAENQHTRNLLNKEIWTGANDANFFKHRQTYRYELTPFLKDSNAYGNIYFARYFEWQGICREMWFTECIYTNMFEMDGDIYCQSELGEHTAFRLSFPELAMPKLA